MARARMPDQDAAVSETLGIVLMVAIAATLAGVLFFWAGIGASPPEAPLEIAIKSDGPLSANAKQFVVSSISAPATWDALLLKLDQSGPLSYDSGLSGNARFCVKLDGSTCVDTAEWDPATTQVKAGQIIRVRDMSLDGQKLLVVHVESNAVVTSAAVGS